jgi:plastocyanin domain-containing protein
MKYFFLSLSILAATPTIFAKNSVQPQVIEISVTEKGFEPSQVDVKPGTPVVLKVTRKTDATCATQVQIPSKKIKKDLPLNTPVTVEIGKLEKGNVPFSCGMNMINGNLHVQ